MSGPLLFLIELGEDLARLAEGGDASRHAAINRDLQKHFADLLARHAVVERALDVDLQLMGPVERANHRQVDQAPRLERQPLAVPAPAPAIFRGELLHRHVEVVRRLERVLDELLPENGLADLESTVECRLVHVCRSRSTCYFGITRTGS